MGRSLSVASLLLVLLGLAVSTQAQAAECCDVGRGGAIEEGWPAHALLIYGTYTDVGVGGLTRTNGVFSGGVARTDDRRLTSRRFHAVRGLPRRVRLTLGHLLQHVHLH